MAFRYRQLGQPPVGLRIDVGRKPETSIPSYALHGYRAVWELRDEANGLVAKGEKALDEMGAEQSLEASFTPGKATALHLHLRLMRPTGFAAAEKTLDWASGLSGGDTVPEMEKRGIVVP